MDVIAEVKRKPHHVDSARKTRERALGKRDRRSPQGYLSGVRPGVHRATGPSPAADRDREGPEDER